jgi:hypothetical protein
MTRTYRATETIRRGHIVVVDVELETCRVVTRKDIERTDLRLAVATQDAGAGQDVEVTTSASLVGKMEGKAFVAGIVEGIEGSSKRVFSQRYGQDYVSPNVT